MSSTTTSSRSDVRATGAYQTTINDRNEQAVNPGEQNYVQTAKLNKCMQSTMMGGCTHGSPLLFVYIHLTGGSPDVSSLANSVTGHFGSRHPAGPLKNPTGRQRQ